MRKWKNLTIVGTSHIAISSVKEVKKIIEETLQPEIVAVELDKKRVIAMFQEKKRKLRLRDIRHIGFKGFIFNAFGAWVEDKLGKVVGVKPGTDMKQAIISAQKVNAKVALIDQDINITLKRLSKELTWREKFRFVGEIIGSIFKRKKAMIKFDLRKVPGKDIIKKLTKQLEQKYPSVYKVLIAERNTVMSKGLYKLMTLEPNSKIVAVVGAGHEDDLIDLVKNEHTIHNT